MKTQDVQNQERSSEESAKSIEQKCTAVRIVDCLSLRRYNNSIL